MSQLLLVTGGARSGKSSFAQTIAEQFGKPTTFIATAQNRDGEMADRIRKHQAERPKNWKTLEAPLDLVEAIRCADRISDVILIDCLTLFISNLLLERIGDPGLADDPVVSQDVEHWMQQKVEEVETAVREAAATVIIVTNEVGSGIVPLYHSARVYRDVAGRANQQFAAAADRVFWVVAGIPIELPSREGSIKQIIEELSDGR